MSIRAIPCWRCHRVPEVRAFDNGAGYAVECPRCGGLCAMGKTEDDAIQCWNHCTDEKTAEAEAEARKPIRKPRKKDLGL